MNEKTLVHITTVPQTLSFLSGQLKYMKEKGFKVYVISSSGARLQQFCDQEDIEYKEVNMLRGINVIKDIISLMKMIYILLKIKPDIVHSHTPKASLISMISSWILRVPVRIYHVHGLVFETSKGFKRKVLMLTERISSLLSTQVLSVSDSLKKEMINNKITKQDKIKVLLNGTVNGIDAKEKFNPTVEVQRKGIKIRKSLNINENDFIIGFVGRFSKDKGINDLVLLWNKLKDKYPNIHLILVGTVSTKYGVSKENINTLKKEERVHLVGHVKDTSLYYSIMDLLIHPSYREGFGQVILEAASMNVPAVSYSVTGCKDAVVNQVTGTLVPKGNLNELESVIENYIADNNLRKKQGFNGRKRALEKFDPSDIWKELYMEYHIQLDDN